MASTEVGNRSSFDGSTLNVYTNLYLSTYIFHISLSTYILVLSNKLLVYNGGYPKTRINNPNAKRFGDVVECN